MTDDDTATRLAALLGEHLYLLDTTACTCGEWVWVECGKFFVAHRAHVATVIVEAGVDFVAEALREAAEDVEDACASVSRACFCGSADWLRARASNIESAAEQ